MERELLTLTGFKLDVETVKAIAEGYTNLLLNRKEELSQKRLDICKECPAYEADYRFGPRCNPNVQVKNENTGKYVYGCGCILASKTRSEKSECPAKKWLTQMIPTDRIVYEKDGKIIKEK